MAYGKDMQEDKEGTFDALSSLSLCVAAVAGMVRDMTPDAARMKRAAGAGHATATDLADWLVRNLGLPFREAHHVTGRIVSLADQKGVSLDALAARRDAIGRAAHHRRCVLGALRRALGRKPQEPWRHRAERECASRRGAG